MRETKEGINMFWKSIYIQITEDFIFLKDFGYEFLYNLKHNVSPSVEFTNNRYRIQIGYNYQEGGFYVTQYDSYRKIPIKKETLDWMRQNEPQNYANFKAGLDEATYIVKYGAMYGFSYKGQVNEVKKVLLKYLEKQKLDEESE